jgi:hypothetical protein
MSLDAVSKATSSRSVPAGPLAGLGVALLLLAGSTGTLAVRADHSPEAVGSTAPVAEVAPHLRAVSQQALRTNQPHTLAVIVHSDRRHDLSRYAERATPIRWVDGYVIFARLDARNLPKVARLEGVRLIEDALGQPGRIEPLVDEELAARLPSIEELRQRMAELKRNEVTYAEAQAVDKAPGVIAQRQAVRGNPFVRQVRAGPQPLPGHEEPLGWWDVESGHKIRQAWDRGFRGQGVRVAVADSGTDFAHPDLQGTWVVITDTNSPYFGYPQAFDPSGLAAYIADVTTGTSNAERGATALISMTQVSPMLGTRSFDDIKNNRGRACFRTLIQPPAPTGGAPPALGTRATEATCDWMVPARSISGQYRFGSHPDRHLGWIYGERPGVLLVDQTQRGVYDTVYVDLDNDHDFTDEKPVTRDSPLSYRDMDGDGLADIGGGLLYYIANGRAPIPGAWLFPEVNLTPPAGTVIGLIGDFDSNVVGWHGTLCASNMYGTGTTPVADDIHVRFRNLPGDGRPRGVVSGAAPDAMVVAIGETYLYALARDTVYRYLMQATDPIATYDDIQVSTHSYGSGSGGGWGTRARFLDRLITRINPRHSLLFSAGNGGPGYSTQGNPDSHVSMQIAASSQMGSTGWDSITDTSQILVGDINPFSSRGPSRDGTAGPEVAANGGRGSGAVALAGTLDGAHAWQTWGGTSRSAPLAGGQMALIHQAYKAAHNEWPDWKTARALMMNGARWMGYDPFESGAGITDVGLSTDLATGRDGVMAMPPDWVAGDWQGREYPAFPNIMYRGSTDETTFTLRNPTDRPIDVTISPQYMRRIGQYELDWVSATITDENDSGAYNFNAPDYLIPVDKSAIPEGTDLMVVNVAMPRPQYSSTNVWRLLVYQHTDIDADGRLWHDRDQDGIVDKGMLSTSHSIDGFLDLDWEQAELDRYEYMRFSYDNRTRNNLHMFVQRPLERWKDGLYIGLQHTARGGRVMTDLKIGLDFFKAVEWPWLSLDAGLATIPPRGQVALRARLTVPPDASYGYHDGMIAVEYTGRAAYEIFVPRISKGSSSAPTQGHTVLEGQPAVTPEWARRRLTIPVHAVVAARANLGVPARIPVGTDEADALYNRGAVTGDVDVRYFFANVSDAPAGTRLVTVFGSGEEVAADSVVTAWGPAPDRFTDPQLPENAQENWADPDFYGPYTLQPIGSSQTGNRLATWFSAPAVPGLHLLEVQKSLFPGTILHAPLALSLSSARLLPASIQSAGCSNVQFRAGLPMPGLQVQTYGLTPRFVHDALAPQDNPSDPNSSSYKYAFDLQNASKLLVMVDGPDDADLDLFVLRDANGDGVFAYPGEQVASATGPTADERILIAGPANGRYAVWVHGWAVAPGGSAYRLTIDAPAGNDITALTDHQGPVAEGADVDLQVCVNLPAGASGELTGEVVVGPPQAPRLVDIPVMVSAP